MKIVSVGDNCMDIYVNCGHKSYVGGNGVNLAVAVRRSGTACAYVGIVGDDAPGADICRTLCKEGVDTSHVTVSKGKTASTKIRLENNERISIGDDLGVQRDYRITQEDFRFIAGHDLVHYTAFTNWSTACIEQIDNYYGIVEAHLLRFRSDGLPVSMDFSDGDTAKLLEICANKTEIGFFSRADLNEDEIRREATRLKQYGFNLVVITRGEQGSLAYDGTNYISQGIVPVAVVDTLGAGDSFMGAFLSKYVAGAATADCLQYAAWYASQVCGRFGGF